MSRWLFFKEDRVESVRTPAQPARRANASKRRRSQWFTVEALEDRLAMTASVTGAGVIHAALIAPAPPTGLGVTTVSLSLSTTQSGYGQLVGLTSRITPTTPGATPTGTVSFFAGPGYAQVLLGVAPVVNGTASFRAWNLLLIGENTITAAYSGDANYSESNSGAAALQVTKSPTVTTLASAGGGLTATVGRGTPGVGTPTGVVAFFDHGRLVGSVMVVNGRATMSAPAGVGHAYTATYYGDNHFNPSTTVQAVTSAAATHHTTVVAQAVPQFRGFR